MFDSLFEILVWTFSLSFSLLTLALLVAWLGRAAGIHKRRARRFPPRWLP